MQIACPQCDHSLTFDSEAPKFCQHCGCHLANSEQLSKVSASAITPNSQNPAEGERAAIGELGTDANPNETPEPGETSKIIAATDVTIPPSGSIAGTDMTVPPSGVFPVHEIAAEPGETVGPYQTVSWLGAGGMGSVWQAIEKNTGRRVALKRLTPSMSNDEESLQRFFQEAQLAAKISHPNVTFIFGTGKHEDTPYIAMELMPGDTLEDEIKKNGGPLRVQDAIDFVIDTIDGLEAVHKKGMIHRDIKPSNCFVDANGRVKIGDFGLSKSVITENASLTKTGTFMGTPSYASPEQIRGIDVDGRTDQYSVGATLYYLLSGQTPYQGDATSMMAQIIGDPPPSARTLNEKVPRDLDAIIRKSLAKSADDRYATLGDLRAALLPYASNFDSVAGIGRRLAAYMIDQTAILAMLYVVGVAVMVVLSVRAGGEVASSLHEGFRFWLSFASAALMWAYYTVGEGVYERTVGKWLMGLKLVNYENQKAGLLRAAFRSLIVPTGLGIGMLYNWHLYRTGNYAPNPNPADTIMMMMQGLLVGWGPILVCLIPMRKNNRLMGLHGLLSGTRVVRSSKVAAKRAFPVTDMRTKKVAKRVFGPYESGALLGECEYGNVYLAHDDRLQRDVWIVSRDSKEPPPVSRMNLARHARQRWLDGGQCTSSMRSSEDNCQRWDGFEAVQGMPIQQLIGMGRLDQCGGYSRLVRQLVQELIAAVDDGSLPEEVRLSQVWVERDGSLKLLDSRLVSTVQVSDKDASMCLYSGDIKVVDQSPTQQAVELLQQLGDIIQRSRVLPHSLSCFFTELYQRPQERSTLEWADQQLSSLEKKTTALTWDIRVGILAMTMGVEFIVFGIISAGIMLIGFYLLPVMMSLRLEIAVGVSLILPMIAAIYFQGGFVFRVMGIRLCNLNGKPASALARAVRAGLSWLPVVALGCSFMIAMILADANAHETAAEPGTIGFEVINNKSLVFAAGITLLTSLAAIAIGIVFAVVSPKRGLIDYLLRTRLMTE